MTALENLGTHLSGRYKGRLCREQLFRCPRSDGEAWVVDLGGVQTLSDAFADELFAVPAAIHGVDWFRENITVLNASDAVRESIVVAVQKRVEPRADPYYGVSRLAPAPEVLEAVATAS